MRAMIAGLVLGCSDASDAGQDEDELMAGAGGAAGAGGTGGAGAGGAGEGGGGSGNGGTGNPGTVAVNEDGVDALAPLPEDVTLPIVFCHGFAGSAQQYESQAQRFAANGYPQERIFAYDHDGAGFDTAAYITGLDEVIDTALAEFGTTQVYLVGHSRGTLVSSMYLGDAGRRAKVAKYIAIDGSPCPTSVPCIAPTQAAIPGQAHVEVATSKESFAMQYEFLVGEPPAVVDIVAQRDPVVLSGRAVNFPANTGRDGATLNVYDIDSDTGARASETPIATFQIDATGDFGPVTVDSRRHYEFELTSDAGTSQHFYPQKFLRDSHFVRLLSGPPDAPSRMNTNKGPGHAAIVALRMREWFASDVLNISTSSEAGDEEAVNAIIPAVGSGAIALHIHDDAGSPAESSLTALDWFSTQPFQNGVDVYMPAAEPTNGTITVTNLPRGDAEHPQTLNFPNWPSDNHLIMVMLADYAQP